MEQVLQSKPAYQRVEEILGDRIELRRSGEPDRIELRAMESSPAIGEEDWSSIHDARARLVAATRSQEIWDHRLPHLMRASSVSFVAYATMIRIGLAIGSIRLVALGFKMGCLGLGLLGIGAGRLRLAIENRKSACDELKTTFKKLLGKKLGEPLGTVDSQKVQEIYDQHLYDCPWILRYYKPTHDEAQLVEVVRAGVINYDQARAQKHCLHHQARHALLFASMLSAGTVASLVLHRGIPLSLSLGVGATFMMLARSISLDTRCLGRRLAIQQAEELTNQAASYSNKVCDAFPRAVTRLVSLEQPEQLQQFPNMRKLGLSNPLERQVYPITLKKLNERGMRTQLSTLPPKLTAFATQAYMPTEAESLDGFVRLKELSFKRIGQGALNNLNSLPLLKRLYVDELETLNHPIFNRLTHVRVNNLPGEASEGGQALRYVGFNQLTLQRPTENCIRAIINMATIQDVTLTLDPGLSGEMIRALFVHGNVRKLKIENWIPSDRISGDAFIALWKEYDVISNGKVLDQAGFEGLLRSTRPVQLIIRIP